jgi:hypothetical protein
MKSIYPTVLPTNNVRLRALWYHGSIRRAFSPGATMSDPALKATDDKYLSGRAIFTVFFGIWGAVGFIINLANFGFASLSASIGVGTSAYLMAGILLWIGGMVLFGIAALLTPPPRY